MCDAFYNGYAPICTLPKAQRQLLDLFAATQFATMLLWASAFLKDGPGRVNQHTPWQNESGEKLLRYFNRAEAERNKQP